MPFSTNALKISIMHAIKSKDIENTKYLKVQIRNTS